ncbi:ATP citrate lyase subunit 1 [Diaporthe australafricana]|uniref:Large ribosomal subunit protein uL30m n=1 Tax=Diaporthe australafricana TaxID=127596 RepID=A0ABR3WMJ7_9PEZI
MSAPAAAAAAAAAATGAATSYFRITLRRSAIGLPTRTRGVLAALGLHRRCQTVFHPVEPQFAGMIMKVKELVRVEEVGRRLTAAELRAERTPDRGFWLESRAGAGRS